jgi:hypothetical protein
MPPQRKRPAVQSPQELRRRALLPKALSGEIPADPIVLIDRRQHYSFNRRVKARGA